MNFVSVYPAFPVPADRLVGSRLAVAGHRGLAAEGHDSLVHSSLVDTVLEGMVLVLVEDTGQGRVEGTAVHIRAVVDFGGIVQGLPVGMVLKIY